MTRPRCVITGSAQGLGAALKHRFEQDFDVIEYDLQYGQDLANLDIRDSVLRDLESAQVFFNNARPFQVELLDRSVLLQNDLAIFNSSSTVGQFELPLDVQDNQAFLAYREEKNLLNQRIHQLQQEQRRGLLQRCWIVNVRMEWLDVPLHQGRTEPLTDPGDVASYLHHVLCMFPRIAIDDVLIRSARLFNDSNV